MRRADALDPGSAPTIAGALPALSLELVSRAREPDLTRP